MSVREQLALSVQKMVESVFTITEHTAKSGREYLKSLISIEVQVALVPTSTTIASMQLLIDLDLQSLPPN